MNITLVLLACTVVADIVTLVHGHGGFDDGFNGHGRYEIFGLSGGNGGGFGRFDDFSWDGLLGHGSRLNGFGSLGGFGGLDGFGGLGRFGGLGGLGGGLGDYSFGHRFGK
ncbi:hypothetical protein CHS0354_018798 [Potamilus streckersoni]|uniref:Uncharacterized protein n=1 Tax=Potamilus streckersoni TaxID=2493646 RepID=A0AAE0TCL8_9BIVA|nr:hypothetical protein CHS0354_018798 [Potamilus streckersoni]